VVMAVNRATRNDSALAVHQDRNVTMDR